MKYKVDDVLHLRGHCWRVCAAHTSHVPGRYVVVPWDIEEGKVMGARMYLPADFVDLHPGVEAVEAPE